MAMWWMQAMPSMWKTRKWCNDKEAHSNLQGTFALLWRVRSRMSYILSEPTSKKGAWRYTLSFQLKWSEEWLCKICKAKPPPRSPRKPRSSQSTPSSVKIAQVKTAPVKKIKLVQSTLKFERRKTLPAVVPSDRPKASIPPVVKRVRKKESLFGDLLSPAEADITKCTPSQSDKLAFEKAHLEAAVGFNDD